VFGEEEDGKMLAFFPLEVIVCTLRRCVGRRVGGEVRRTERKRRLAMGSEVGF